MMSVFYDVLYVCNLEFKVGLGHLEACFISYSMMSQCPSLALFVLFFFLLYS